MKIFIINQYISKSYTTTSRILLTDNLQSGGSCNVNCYCLVSISKTLFGSVVKRRFREIMYPKGSGFVYNPKNPQLPCRSRCCPENVKEQAYLVLLRTKLENECRA